jgi:hypothetical protein
MQFQFLYAVFLFICLFIYLFIGAPGVWIQGLTLVRQVLYHLNCTVNPFFCVLNIFKIGFWELFAQVGFELWSFWSLPPQ